MSLLFKTYIEVEFGTLIAIPSGKKTGVWLRNREGVFNLYVKDKSLPAQLEMPFYPARIIPFVKFLNDHCAWIFARVGCFMEGHEHLLKMLFDHGLPAMELLEDCPCLALLVADSGWPIKDHLQYRGHVSRLLQMKRHEMLTELGYPPGKWIARMLKKVPPEESCFSVIRGLREILRRGDDSMVKILRHMSAINRLVVLIMRNAELYPYVDNRFLAELCSLKWDDYPDQFYNEILELGRLYSVAQNQDGISLPRLSSLEDVFEAHALLVDWTNGVGSYEDIAEVKFARPPIPGVESMGVDGRRYGITPLSTGQELWTEGVRMHHCIASYTDEIVKSRGLKYIYHVHYFGYKAATLLIQYVAGDWEIAEMRGPCNSSLPAQYYQLVRGWLSGTANEDLDDFGMI